MHKMMMRKQHEKGTGEKERRARRGGVYDHHPSSPWVTTLMTLGVGDGMDDR